MQKLFLCATSLVLALAGPMARAGQAKPKIIVLDGTPAAGKSSLSKAVCARLRQQGQQVMVIESDALAAQMPKKQGKIPWGAGVHAAVRKAEKAQQQGKVVVLDAFLWPHLRKRLARTNKYYYVLAYAPLAVVKQRFAARAGIKKLAAFRHKSLERDFACYYLTCPPAQAKGLLFVASCAQEPGSNVYARQTYDLILHTQGSTPEDLACSLVQAYQKAGSAG